MSTVSPHGQPSSVVPAAERNVRPLPGETGVIPVRQRDRRQPRANTERSRGRSRILIAATGLAVTASVIAVGGWVWAPAGETLTGEAVLHTVERTDLDITVTERGNMESQINEVVVCEVDDVRDDGISGTPIVWIVDNGASVKKGDLIVELDSAPIRERYDQQVLEVEEEKAEFIQAEVQYRNQQTQNETRLAEAELAVRLAELALQQFGDDAAGTFQLSLQDIELQIQEAEAGRLIEKTNLHGVEQLYQLGYRSSNELAEARLNALRSDRALATAMSRKRELVEYEYKKRKMELEGAVSSAERARDQVELDNMANLAQSEARLASSREQLMKEEERLARYESQINKCKIYAPQDGMVAYWTGGSRYRREEIRAGAPVRPRQKILTLPNLTKMQVKTSVHESVLDQISTDLKATVGVDAFPEAHYDASVASVAVLPDQGGWLNSDTKVYQTVVTIDEDVSQLKPGMTAVVEIHVAHLEDVVAIPVQAVIQRAEDTWCYVQDDDQYERRSIELGMTNSKYVEVKSGLEPGEELVLNPTVIPDHSDVTTKSKSETESSKESVTSSSRPTATAMTNS